MPPLAADLLSNGQLRRRQKGEHKNKQLLWKKALEEGAALLSNK
jgi:hypothetical protein